MVELPLPCSQVVNLAINRRPVWCPKREEGFNRTTEICQHAHSISPVRLHHCARVLCKLPGPLLEVGLTRPIGSGTRPWLQMQNPDDLDLGIFLNTTWLVAIHKFAASLIYIRTSCLLTHAVALTQLETKLEGSKHAELPSTGLGASKLRLFLTILLEEASPPRPHLDAFWVILPPRSVAARTARGQETTASLGSACFLF